MIVSWFADSVEAIRELTSADDRFVLDSVSGPSVQMQGRGTSVGSVGVSIGRQTPMRFRGGAADHTRQGALFTLPISGVHEVAFGREQRIVGPGGAMFSPSGGDPIDLNTNETVTFIRLAFDDEALDRPRVRDFAPVMISRSGLAAPLRSFVAAFLRDGVAPTASEVAVAENVVRQLVSAVLMDAAGLRTDSETVGLALAVRADTVIERRWSEPSTTPATIAAELGVSVRHLQRAFALRGGEGVAETIRHRRARTARELLDGAFRSRRLTEVAVASGFRSERELRAAFVAAHGLNPSEYRESRGEHS
ncbi:AraC family transcriptional regulator [Microbacteriaceae bacterium VKM Ac-2854]|nr:AraC family transcriptional regulator [Microbacteriaceae bacterium VKM Ac-2854]